MHFPSFISTHRMKCFRFIFLLSGLVFLSGCLPLEQEVAMTKKTLPRSVGNGMTWTDIQSTDGEVSFYYDLASHMSIDSSKKDEVKEKMLETLKQNKRQFAKLVAYNVRLKYVIRQNNSEVMSISFEPSELAEKGVSAGGGAGIAPFGLVLGFLFLGLLGVCVPRPRGRSYKADLEEQKKKRRKRA